MAGLVRLNQIWAMLDQCAPGATRRATAHRYHVTYNQRTFRTLPLGEHGSRRNPEIEWGYVRQLVTHLLIDWDCAKDHFPQLGNKPKAIASSSSEPAPPSGQ